MNFDLHNYIFAVIILLAISALFSCFETAITASSKAKAHRLANEGNKKAKILEELLKNRDKVISTMLLGNNAINILASAIATIVLEHIFGSSGIIYATVIMTIAVLVFSEVLPKTYAIHHANQVSLFFARPIAWLVKVFFPFINLIHKMVNFCLNFRKKNYQETLEEKHIIERNEIRDTIYLKHKEGSIYGYDRKMIEGVLDLAEIEICEIMIHRNNIFSLNINLPTQEIIEKSLELNHSKIPLWSQNCENIVSILNVKKLLKSLHFSREEKNFDWENFNLKPYLMQPWFVPSTNSLRTQLSAFRKKRQKMALVVDEYGSLQGIITLEDILEEIVGEFSENNNQINSEIAKLKDGWFKIDGKTMVRNINKKLDWNLEEEVESYNLAGLIISKLGFIPAEQEKFTIDNYQFEILEKKHNQISKIKAKQQNKLAKNK